MPLQPKQIEIPLNGGMDTKVATELQEANTLRAVTNLRWDAIGELSKRPTHASSATVSAPSGSRYADATVETLFGRGKEVCALTTDFGVVTVDPQNTSSALFSRRTVNYTGSPTAVLRYSPRACKVSRRFIERAQFGAKQAGIYQVASAVYNGVMVVAWVEYATDADFKLQMKAIDVASGTIVASNEQVLLSINTVFAVNAIPYYVAGSEGVLITHVENALAPFSIYATLYNASARSFTNLGTLTNDAYVPAHSIANNQDGNGPIYFGYITNTLHGGLNVPEVYTGTAAQIVAGTGTLHRGQHSANSVSFAVGATRALIISTSAATSYAEIFGRPADYISVHSSTSSETFLSCTGTRDDNGANQDRAVMLVNAYGAATSSSNGTSIRFSRVRAAVVDFNSVSGPPTLSTLSSTPNAWAATNAFTIGGRAHCAFTLSPEFSETATSLIVARYTEPVVGSGARFDAMARLCHDRFYDFGTAFFGASQAASVVGNKVYITLTADPSADRVAGTGNKMPQTIFLSTIEFPDAGMPLPNVEADGVTSLCSGMLIDWDGDTPSESQAVTVPSVLIDATNSGSTTVANSVSVIAIWRWVDSAGRLHRSAPSAPSTHGAFTTQQIDVYVSRPPFFAYDGTTTQALEPELYITVNNGSTYYLANNSSGYKATFSNTDSRNTYWLFEDVQIGSDSNPTIYSDGSATAAELASEAPPAFRSIARIADRFWAIDAEDRSRVWYTKPFVQGIAPEWSSFLTLNIGDDGVGIVDVNGVPTIFGERGIWQVFGEGPDAAGTGGVFSTPRRLPHEVSCIDPTSICKTPLGTVFRSRRGFYVLGAGLDLQPFGVPMDPELRQSSLASYGYCRVAFDETHNEVRVIDVQPSGAQQFVFNLLEQKWSEWTMATGSQYHTDIAVVDGRVWYVHNGTAIRREYAVDESGATTSTEAWSIQTPWLKLDGIAGFGRVHDLILQVKTRSDASNITTLTAVVETRAPETGTDTFTWSGSDISSLGSSVPVDLRMKIRSQRCKAFRVTITETPGTAYLGSSPIALRAVLGVDGKAIRQVRGAALKGST